MSWLSQTIGQALSKAENMLDTLDQTAGENLTPLREKLDQGDDETRKYYTPPTQPSKLGIPGSAPAGSSRGGASSQDQEVWDEIMQSDHKPVLDASKRSLFGGKNNIEGGNKPLSRTEVAQQKKEELAKKLAAVKAAGPKRLGRKLGATKMQQGEDGAGGATKSGPKRLGRKLGATKPSDPNTTPTPTTDAHDSTTATEMPASNEERPESPPNATEPRSTTSGNEAPPTPTTAEEPSSSAPEVPPSDTVDCPPANGKEEPFGEHPQGGEVGDKAEVVPTDSPHEIPPEDAAAERHEGVKPSLISSTQAEPEPEPEADQPKEHRDDHQSEQRVDEEEAAEKRLDDEAENVKKRDESRAVENQDGSDVVSEPPKTAQSTLAATDAEADGGKEDGKEDGAFAENGWGDDDLDLDPSHEEIPSSQQPQQDDVPQQPHQNDADQPPREDELLASAEPVVEKAAPGGNSESVQPVDDSDCASATELKAEKKRSDDLQGKLVAALAEQEKLQEEHERLLDRITAVEETRKSLMDANETLLLEKEEVEGEIARTKEENTVLKEEITSMSTDYENLSKEFEEMEAKYAERENVMKKKVKEMIEEKEVLTSAAQHLEEEIRIHQNTEMKLEEALKKSKRKRAEQDDAKESEYQANLEGKDSMISALKEQLEQSKEVLKAREETLVFVQEEKSRLEKEQSAAAEAHAEILQKSRDEIERLQSAAEDLEERHADELKRQLQREQTLETENAELSVALSAAQRAVDDKVGDESNFTSQIHALEGEVESLKNQLKESKSELQNERTKLLSLEQSVVARRDEADTVRKELMDYKASAASDLSEREETIKGLKQKLANMSDSQHATLETRIQTLADQVIQKQTQLQTVSSEKAALQLQVENERKRVRELEEFQVAESHTGGRRRRQAGRDIEDPETVTFDSFSERNQLLSHPRIKTAATFLDRLSLDLGRLLRVYPLARIGMIVYALALHLWLFFIMYVFRPISDTHPQHEDNKFA